MKRKWMDNIFVLYIKTFLLILGGQFIGSLLTSLVFYGLLQIWPSLQDSPAWITGISYVYFIGIWLLTLLILFVFPKNRPILKEL